eukprot:351253-Chlamydomonas_euryale.AAC.9
MAPLARPLNLRPRNARQRRCLPPAYLSLFFQVNRARKAVVVRADGGFIGSPTNLVGAPPRRPRLAAGVRYRRYERGSLVCDHAAKPDVAAAAALAVLLLRRRPPRHGTRDILGTARAQEERHGAGWVHVPVLGDR